MGHHKWSSESLSCPLTHLKALRLHLLDGRYVIKSNLWGCLCSGSPEGNGCTAQAFTFCFPPFRLQANLYAPPPPPPCYDRFWWHGLTACRTYVQDGGMTGYVCLMVLKKTHQRLISWVNVLDDVCRGSGLVTPAYSRPERITWINKIKKSNFLD